MQGFLSIIQNMLRRARSDPVVNYKKFKPVQKIKKGDNYE